MFIYFRLSVWFAVAALGPAQAYRQSSVGPAYLRAKVGQMVKVEYMFNTHLSNFSAH